MTVIATVITSQYTAHATDSFITVARADGTREVVEDQAPKLVRVPAWRGALAYWGLARLGNDWDTLAWLRARAAQAGGSGSPEEFAIGLANELATELGRRRFQLPVHRGMGVHFTAYEYISGYWVPELFLVSNWTDRSYTAVKSNGFSVTRETYATLKGLSDRPPEQREARFRREVHSALHQNGVMFRFNNGDPVLFNHVADAILNTFLELRSRRHLRDPISVKTHLSLVWRPIDVVSKLLADMADQGSRVIGGKPHDLAVDPSGEYRSNTGD